MTKRYYWLKLNEHFLDDDKIQYLETQENGEMYAYFYIKLLLKCLKNKDNGDYGFLRFTDKIPYDDKMLSKITNTHIDTVRVAMKMFQQLDMLEILDNKTIYIESVNKMIGSESESAERVRIHRKKITALQCNEPVTEMLPNKEIEIDKEIELDTDKEVNNSKTVKKKPENYFYYNLFKKNVINNNKTLPSYKQKETMSKIDVYFKQKLHTFKNKKLPTVRVRNDVEYPKYKLSDIICYSIYLMGKYKNTYYMEYPNIGDKIYMKYFNRSIREHLIQETYIPPQKWDYKTNEWVGMEGVKK